MADKSCITEGERVYFNQTSFYIVRYFNLDANLMFNLKL